jgi:hypothetical protein
MEGQTVAFAIIDPARLPAMEFASAGGVTPGTSPSSVIVVDGASNTYLWLPHLTGYVSPSNRSAA